MYKHYKWLVPVVCFIPLIGMTAQEAKVFPVKGFFYDSANDSKLDPIFRGYLSQQSSIELGINIFNALSKGFGSRVDKLNGRTAGNTFAVSVHVTRASSFSVDKGNGNSDIATTLTGSVYFTNVITGEILTTITRSVISRNVVSNKSNLTEEKRNLFKHTLENLIQDLVAEAPKNFNPTITESHVTDRSGDLIILDGGYRKGFATGDKIEDAADNLIEIVYAGDTYAVAKPVLASNINLGATFQKFNAHAASGKDRPRVSILIESLPTGYAKDYIARLFGELLGDAAPFTVIQINTEFTRLLQTVREQDDAELSTIKSTGRLPPDFIIRLRIPEALSYEVGTNLRFQNHRHYETRVFADVIDNTGRILYSTSGFDVINEQIVNGIGVGPEERKEVNLKNALTDLANKFNQLGELKRDQSRVVASQGNNYQIDSQGKVYGDRQRGLVLYKNKVRFGKETKEILLPSTEAVIQDYTGQPVTDLSQGLPIDHQHPQVSVGDLFEVLRFGTTPKTPNSFSVCEPVEILGSTPTPLLLQNTGLLLGQKMPGIFYAPEATRLTKGIIETASGFSSAFSWDLPVVPYCIQAVDRANIGDEQCAGDQCERSIVSRYTLRLKKGEEVISRFAFEGQFKSTGYYNKTSVSDQIKRLLEIDISNLSRSLLDKTTTKLIFP